MKLFKNENPFVAAAAFSLIPVGAYVAFIVACSLSVNPSFNDTYLFIEASFNRMATVNRKVWLEIIGLVLSIGIPFGYVIKNGGLGKGEGDKTPGHIYAISWVLLLLTFLPAITKQGDSEYSKYFDNQKEYEYYKANPKEADALFPDGK